MKKRNIKALVNKAIREGGYMNMIEKISLFGSYARGEENEKSDIDLLVEFAPRSDIGLIGFIGIQEKFEEILGKKVDLVTSDGVSPHLRDDILSQAKPIYEK